jgi:hypothetical protein
MRRRKVPTLKDEERPLLERTLQSLKRELAARYEAQADRLMGISKPVESNSLPTISGAVLSQIGEDSNRLRKN